MKRCSSTGDNVLGTAVPLDLWQWVDGQTNGCAEEYRYSHPVLGKTYPKCLLQE